MYHRLGLAILTVSTLFTSVGRAQEMPGDYQEALKFLGRKGDFKAGVLKIGLPRNDLQVTVAGVPTPTPFGFSGWVAMTKGDHGKDVVMGDLVLLQDEVNPVMSSLLEHGLDVTALHNHFFWEEPRIFYMHVHGHGKALDVARQLKPALDLIGHVVPLPATPPVPDASTTGTADKLDTARITAIVGHSGEMAGSVYKITLGRDDLKVKEMGATINTRMGLNTWAAFLGTNDSAVVAGDVAMREGEVTPVLKALRENNLDVVAIHHHMTNLHPMIVFLHYWGRGPVEKLASGFRAALNELGKSRRKPM